jgi:hypothetical protein
MDWPVPGTITREPLAAVVQLDSHTRDAAKRLPQACHGKELEPEPEPEPEPVMRDEAGLLSPRTATFEEDLNRPTVDMGTPHSLPLAATRGESYRAYTHVPLQCVCLRRVAAKAMLERNPATKPPGRVASALGMHTPQNPSHCPSQRHLAAGACR